MYVTCENQQTATIVQAAHTEGAGLTWTLDPHHFTARVVRALTMVLQHLAETTWKHCDGSHPCPVSLVVARRDDLPCDAPVVTVSNPGLLAFMFAAAEVTAEGIAAFQAAMAGELRHWEQIAA